VLRRGVDPEAALQVLLRTHSVRTRRARKPVDMEALQPEAVRRRPRAEPHLNGSVDGEPTSASGSSTHLGTRQAITSRGCYCNPGVQKARNSHVGGIFSYQLSLPPNVLGRRSGCSSVEEQREVPPAVASRPISSRGGRRKPDGGLGLATVRLAPASLGHHP
jgi:hypothetical protein